jgi:hypothetical protein
MLISSILQVHQDEALPRSERIINDLNIGDAFLYRNHLIYRNLRDSYWELGYRFDTHDFCYLFDLPLFSLDLILTQRKMPIRDTVSPLVDLTRRFPEAIFDDLSFDSSLAYPINHILHHSVHCVSDHVSQALVGSTETLGGGPLAVLRVLLCESFGNSIDILSNIEANQRGEAGRDLFIMNNLVFKLPEECEPYAKLVERVGLKAAIQIVALFFLFRNLLAESIDAEFLGRALRTFGVDCPQDADLLDELVRLFDQTTLSFGFRIITTTRYFRYLGFEFGDLLDLYDFDLLELAESHPGVAQMFDAVAELIASGSESPYLARFAPA